MIRGLELAGKNPTRSTVIHDLRHLTSYNGGGLLPNSVDYSTIFGHDLPQLCGWCMIAEKTGFVSSSTKPVCGRDLRGTTTVSS